MHFSSFWVPLLVAPLPYAAGNPGVKMTVENGQGEFSNQRTIYLQPDRKRVEFRNTTGAKRADSSTQTNYGPRLVAITRCDLGQAFELNLDTREYTATPYPPEPLTKQQLEARGLQKTAQNVSDKPTLRIEVTTTDTASAKKCSDTPRGTCS
jgi:hypothetical protein